MYYSDEVIDEVISRNDIVNVISGYVSLRKKGRTFEACCPFHHEKTPSFKVDRDKQLYHCFGCGAGGNVFTFIMEYENMSFPEAVQYLADKAGMTLPESNQSGQDASREKYKILLRDMNKTAAAYFHYIMRHTEHGKKAYEYFKGRGLSDETINQFGLGYADIYRDDLYRYLKGKGYTDAELKDSGLVVIDEKNGGSDKFWNRAMIPILDINGKVIGFGGRVMGDGKPKYINTSDTVVFDKSRNLFAMNIARRSRRKGFICCEGYMDVISMHQAGFDNAVASLGTALTENQGRLLRKYSEKVIISYDSDGAGQAATLRGLEILKNIGCDVRILQMEGAKDPDEYVIKYGNGRFNLLVENAISLVEFKVKVLKKNLNLENANDKIKFLKETAKLLQKIDSKIEQEIYIDKISKEYGISKEAIYAEINKQTGNKTGNKILEKSRSVVVKKQNKEIPAVLQKREDAIIALLINGDKNVYEQIKHRILPSDLKLEVNKKIVEKVYNEYEKSGDIANNIIDLFTEDQEAVNKLTEIMADEYQQQIDKKTIDSIINIYEKEKLTLLKSEIIQKLKETEDSDTKQVLEQELNDIIIKLTKLK